MKIHSRKKVLLSSVAMTLVAAVSLGTATFAWFSNNNSAKAQGFNVETSKSSSIVVSQTGDDDDWHSTIDYKTEANTVLNPVTTADVSTWIAAKADEANGRGFDPATITSVTGTTRDDYRYTKTFYVKSEGESITANWALSNAEGITADDLTYLRIAVEIDDTSYIWCDKNVDDANPWVSFSDTTGENVPEKKYGETGATAENTIAKSSNNTGSVNLTADEGKTVTLTMWYEGTDPNCTDLAAGVIANSTITFTKQA